MLATVVGVIFAVAAAPVPPPPTNVTVGALVYPLPPAVTVILATEFTGGEVLVNVTVGTLVYPLPPAVTVQLETVGEGQYSLKLLLLYLDVIL
jgi:hypothetical protein